MAKVENIEEVIAEYKREYRRVTGKTCPDVEVKRAWINVGNVSFRPDGFVTALEMLKKRPAVDKHSEDVKVNEDFATLAKTKADLVSKPVLGVVPSTKALSIVGSSRNNGEREAEDFYPTPPYAVEELLKREVFSGNIWECACGEGDISEVFKNKGFEVISTDLIDRGYGEQLDFLQSDLVADNIVTNPPYKLALDFVLKAKKQGRKKIAMFLKTVWLESESRYEMFQDTEFPLKTVYQFSKRVTLYKGGVKMKNSGMIAYAWYVWDKDYVGKPTIEWIR